jgi:hypothetical protein
MPNEVFALTDGSHIEVCRLASLSDGQTGRVLVHHSQHSSVADTRCVLVEGQSAADAVRAYCERNSLSVVPADA